MSDDLDITVRLRGDDNATSHEAADLIERLRLRAAMADAYRELPEQYHQGMLELLVKAAYEHCAISTGRAAELLKCGIVDIREKGWVQGRYDEERVADLEQRLAAAEAASGVAPCGHDNRFIEWEDHSKPISCVKCRLAAAEAREQTLRGLLRFVCDFHDARTTLTDSFALAMPVTRPYVLPSNFLSDAEAALEGKL